MKIKVLKISRLLYLSMVLFIVSCGSNKTQEIEYTPIPIPEPPVYTSVTGNGNVVSEENMTPLPVPENPKKQKKEKVRKQKELVQEVIQEDPVKIDPQVTWKLSQLNGKEASEVFEAIPTLKFDVVEPRIYGNGGCNRYMSVFSREGNSFTISKSRTTRIACQNKNDEAGFLKALESVTSIEIQENTLLLFSNNEVVLKFEK